VEMKTKHFAEEKTPENIETRQEAEGEKTLLQAEIRQEVEAEKTMPLVEIRLETETEKEQPKVEIRQEAEKEEKQEEKENPKEERPRNAYDWMQRNFGFLMMASFVSGCGVLAWEKTEELRGWYTWYERASA